MENPTIQRNLLEILHIVMSMKRRSIAITPSFWIHSQKSRANPWRDIMSFSRCQWWELYSKNSIWFNSTFNFFYSIRDWSNRFDDDRIVEWRQPFFTFWSLVKWGDKKWAASFCVRLLAFYCIAAHHTSLLSPNNKL